MPSRRSVTQFAVAGTVTAWLPAVAQAQTQSATPSAEPLPPKELLRRLQESPITSQLFPRDSGEMTIQPWEDDSDSDLEGTLGAVLVNDASLGDGEEDMIGAFIVHPGIDSASERMDAQLQDGGSDKGVDLFGYGGGYGLSPDGYALLALAVGPVIISSFAQAPGKRGADEPFEFDAMALEARAIANMAGLLDHLRLIQQPEQS